MYEVFKEKKLFLREKYEEQKFREFKEFNKNYSYEDINKDISPKNFLFVHKKIIDFRYILYCFMPILINSNILNKEQIILHIIKIINIIDLLLLKC